MSLNRSFATVAVSLLILFAAKPSQAQPKGMRFDIPFGFNVGDKALPAGAYVVEIDKTAGYIELHNKTEFARLRIGAAPALRDGKEDALRGRLSFYSYGTAYVLKKIWMAGEIRGALLESTMAEREMARTAPPKTVAEISLRR